MSCCRSLFPSLFEEECVVVEFFFRDENHRAVDKGEYYLSEFAAPTKRPTRKVCIVCVRVDPLYSTYKSMSRAITKR